jgi:YD repeat-containing protein
VTYNYDNGGRVSSSVDSVNGTITRVFDDMGRLESETTPQGSVSYTIAPPIAEPA